MSGNRQKWTWSGWVKRSAFGDTATMFAVNGGTTHLGRLYINANNQIGFYDESGTFCDLLTAGLYRDPSAWYHVALMVDTTQFTSTNRIKIYVNGLEQPLTGTYPGTQNQPLNFNTTYQYNIGTPGWTSIWLSGYLSDVNFIDS